MQNGLEKIETAGATLVALSYDEPEALREFSIEFGVTYPMLSDPQSLVIQELGILNTLIAEDDHPWFGIPFPGVYVTDAEGTIRSKFFENHLALRPGVDQLVRAIFGETVEVDAHATVEEVECVVTVDDSPIPPGVLRELCVTLRVPEGQHLYGEPVPTGMVATSVELDQAEHLVVLPTTMPPTHSHVLKGTAEELQVFDGDVVIGVPFTHSAALTARSGTGGASSQLTVSGTVRWQACDDDACRLPSSQRFEFTLSTVPINRPSRQPDTGGMDTGALLQRMVARRGPDSGF